ncbi:MAG: DUF2007 domain-containing protein [Pirellulales bacterium]
MTDDELATVYTTTHPADAEMVRLALADEGLAAFVDGPTQGGLVGVLQVHVCVARHEAEQARQLIEEMRRPTLSEEVWDEALGKSEDEGANEQS